MPNIPFAQPTLPAFEEIAEDVSRMLSSHQITNAEYVKKFEEKCREYTGAKHTIAVSSCTAGLMLSLKCLSLKGEVITPSFTFSATSHALVWNNLTPVFADIDKETYCIDPQCVERLITKKTSAILAAYIFGNPPDIKALQEITERHNLKLIFDAAHALGSQYQGMSAGNFGDAEIFSLSPTKLVTSGEGGIVATDDDELAGKLKIGRDYGNPGNYNCEFAGLNARMAEFNAILGLKGLEMLEKNVARRNGLVQLYKSRLGKIGRLSFQKIEPGNRTTYKDFSIIIDPAKAGISRDKLAEMLEKEGIMTKKYFYPPVHRQDAYKKLFKKYKNSLPVTDKVADNILCLPLYSHMDEKDVEKVCDSVSGILCP